MKKNYVALEIVCLMLENDVVTASGETDNLQKWSNDWFTVKDEGGAN
ncbi:MAG: hypothetical protein IJY62_05385 [Clostridia bacterium]|nr:hypothetical protein [Clostridia bacterium]